jgi:uncharacterized protein with NRDE domain
MCIILIAYHAHREYPLVIAANRDEAYARPTAPAAFWHEEPDILAGRDLEQGGTWLGLRRNGRVAAVTNFREGLQKREAPHSRGTLVSGFLKGSDTPATYMDRVQRAAADFNGFILIAGDLETLYWYSNRGPAPAQITPGVHGLSNHLLNTPWPKIRRSKEIVAGLFNKTEAELATGLFELLADRSIAPDHELPETGVGLQRERELSPVFIAADRYGTRASTVVLVHRDGSVFFCEKSFGPEGHQTGTKEEHLRLDTVNVAAADSSAARV